MVICFVRTKKRKPSMQWSLWFWMYHSQWSQQEMGAEMHWEGESSHSGSWVLGHCCHIIYIAITGAHFFKVTRSVGTKGLMVSPRDGTGQMVDSWSWLHPLGDRRQRGICSFVCSSRLLNICQASVLAARDWLEILHKCGFILHSDCCVSWGCWCLPSLFLEVTESAGG